jgi:hypothetical protein
VPLISASGLAVAPAETNREEIALWLSDGRSAAFPATLLLLVLSPAVAIPEVSPAAVVPAASVRPAATDKDVGADCLAGDAVTVIGVGPDVVLPVVLLGRVLTAP